MSLIGQDKEAKIIQRFARHVSSGKVNFFKQAGIAFVPGKREGIYLYGLDGSKLINCHCNGGVFNLGHRHPEVIAALREALNELDIGNHHLISEPRARLAEKLAEISPGDLRYVVFGVGGGEAIDLAIKLARGFTGNPGILSACGGYHGHTGFALSAGDKQYHAPFQPVAPHFTQLPFGKIEPLEEAMDEQTAAVLLETIPATLGIVVPPEDYFLKVRELCDARGVLLIADEVQTGLGRCGAIWGIDTYGVVPDILVTGKGLSGGIYPMSATLYREKLNRFFEAHPFIHISTFGGAEVGCAVALKVLEILTRNGFLAHVQQLTKVFEKGLAKLKAAHGAIVVEMRQRGLMMGIKMVNEVCGPLLTLAGFQHGILTIYANNDPSVSQLLPPLILTEEEADVVLEKLDTMLSDVEKRVNGN